jgi:two-component system, OmpR family, phosphate regulon response regulator PhoB
LADSQQRRPVLIIDDDAEIRQLVRLLLVRINLESVGAETAGAGAEILSGSPTPLLLILDLMLPGISGMDFLRQMRSTKIFDSIPVLVLSALIDPDQIRTALDAGADRYLTKPYIANNLVPIVQDLLRTGRRARGPS